MTNRIKRELDSVLPPKPPRRDPQPWEGGPDCRICGATPTTNHRAGCPNEAKFSDLSPEGDLPDLEGTDSWSDPMELHIGRETMIAILEDNIEALLENVPEDESEDDREHRNDLLATLHARLERLQSSTTPNLWTQVRIDE